MPESLTHDSATSSQLMKRREAIEDLEKVAFPNGHQTSESLAAYLLKESGDTVGSQVYSPKYAGLKEQLLAS